ncbi:hypothetical protein LUZ61_002231 [Rhynchospora tenuis]|uniref:DUF1421 domain-containing protein n=1 Tax=Rhynchospora tenuis TaxID=198213 RepID=A0AAD5ZIQ6_9POAL|nr:hypothetical protein LUZ61_002231 [Rhynchospora tenuis]
MNTSQFMDKQILDLMNHQQPPQHQHQSQEEEESLGRHSNGDTPTTKEEILASYDFQPIRTVGFSPPRTSSGTGTVPVTSAGSGSTWGSLDSRMASSNLKSAGIMEPQVLTEVTHKEERSAAPSYGAASLAEIDRTVKKYADNLLHALEGVSARLSQLESRTHHMENSVDDLKLVVGNYTGSTDGKLRQFENILREVQSGVQILRDKQEIMETQLHLSKLQQQPEQQTQHQSKPSSESTPTAPAPDTSLALTSQPHQLPLQVPPPPPQAPSSQNPSLPTPNAPPPPQIQYPPQNQNPSVPALPAPNAPQYPPQMAQSAPPSVPPYFPSQPQQVDPAHQQPYHQPPQSQPQPQHPPQQGMGGYQQSPPHPQPQAQPPPPSQYAPYAPNPTSQPPAEETNLPYGTPPAQHYPPRGPAPPPYMQQSPPSGPLPPPFYGPPSSGGMYNEPPPTNRPGYGPPVDSYPYGAGSPSYRGAGGMKPNSPFASGSVGSGGGKYENLPTAKILPQATPVGSSAGSGNRVPLDDVVEKVSMMGFSREQVRATVRKLTENGQNVDLNVVLDKLMNEGAGGDMIQPRKGWFP